MKVQISAYNLLAADVADHMPSLGLTRVQVLMRLICSLGISIATDLLPLLPLLDPVRQQGINGMQHV